jgi:phosphate transport system substrate-binding protein
MSRRGWAAFLAIAVMGSLSACRSSSSGNNNVDISGAGSTFVYPVMTRWIHDFSGSHPNVRINYQSIGSGGGIQQVKAKTVDFGASDAALNDQQLAGMQPLVQIPESAGPVCITYNLPGLTQPLQLSPEALAGIFLGTIKTWQDPLLKKDNPGVKLPRDPVIVSHRSDGSGTTSIFTTYLTAVSPEWKSKVGKGTAVSWPIGIGGKGSEGVTGNIRNSPGAIGYVELTYAQQNHLPTAAI